MRTAKGQDARGAEGPDAARGIDTWIRTQAAPLLALARRYLRDEAASREVVQEVLSRALRGPAVRQSPAAFGDRLRRETRHRALRKLRGRPSRSDAPIEALLPRFRADGRHTQAPVAWSSSGRAALSADALDQVVRACVDRLPEPHRTVLMLGDGEGLDTHAIAGHLAIGEGLVREQLHEARLALRTLLDPYMRGARSLARGSRVPRR